jgi:hypothetical protein
MCFLNSAAGYWPAVALRLGAAGMRIFSSQYCRDIAAECARSACGAMAQPAGGMGLRVQVRIGEPDGRSRQTQSKTLVPLMKVNSTMKVRDFSDFD